MKRQFCFALLLLIGFLISPGDKVHADENLLVNPNAENEMQGWTDPDGLWYPSAPITPVEGSYFFWPSKSGCEFSLIYQDVDVTGYGSGNWVELSGWMANWDQTPHDEAIMQLEFLDKEGNVLTQYNRTQRNPQWKQHAIQAQIPAKGVIARVSLIAKRYVGNDNDAYFDDLNFHVIDGTFWQIYITGSKATAKSGDKIQLKANNGSSSDAANFIWSSSYDSIATVSSDGLVTFTGSETDEVAIYAEDIKTGFIGVYYINSANTNLTIVPAQVKGLKESNVTKTSITLAWSKVSKAEGYYVYQYSSSKKKWVLVKTIKSPATTNVKLSNLKAGSSYRFKVAAYTVYGDMNYTGTLSKEYKVSTAK